MSRSRTIETYANSFLCRLVRSGQVIRAIEAAAAAEERGVFQPAVLHRARTERHRGQRNEPAAGDDDGDEGPCCEKHALRIKRSALHTLDERVKDTSLKVWRSRIRCCRVYSHAYVSNIFF